ncbi:MAG: FIST C-terminal domain-containing protein [Candidatus Omnitrophica bacterium]|nr:FIST C-terminal domain-containing protein [Candidatus Omnitrophota bacterium]MCF7893665.1 FIST C-terminal domain-containing protein [Candidatus Omnitrophota bacterium]
MKKNEYFIYLNQKENDQAAKETSLEIKARFKNNPDFIFILFTPGYNPKKLSQVFNLTLKNPNLFAIQAPLLIYKDKIIEKGLISCCLNKKDAKIKSLFIGSQNSEKIEYILKKYFREIRRKNIKFISFISSQMNSLSFLKGIRFSLGKLINFSGAGYKNKYSSQENFILNKGIGNGLVSLILNGISTNTLYLQNFIPFGKPFNITRLNPKQQIIYEINNKPAVEIYKYYFEEKFNNFIKNRLFPYYPLGIFTKNYFRLLTIIDILEDGSFLFKGNLRDKTQGNLMTLRDAYPKKDLRKKLEKSEKNDAGIVFMVNSLERQKILGKKAEKEIENIQNIYSPKKEIIGIYSDYYLFPDEETQDINIESGGLLLNVWE